MPCRILFILLCVCIPYHPTLFGQSAISMADKCRTELRSGNTQKAYTLITQAINSQPDDKDLYLLKAQICFEMADYECTIQSSYKTLELDPNNATAYIFRGKVGIATNSGEAAVTFFTKAAKYANDDSVRFIAYLELGKWQTSQKKFQEAEINLKKAHRLLPHEPEALFLLSDMYFQKNHPDTALLYADSTLLTDQAHTSILPLKASILTSLKRENQAIEILERYRITVPDDGYALIQLSELLLRTGNLARASIVITDAYHQLPNEPMVFKVYSDIHFTQRQTDEGCNQLFRAFQIGYLQKYGYDIVNEYKAKCECAR